MSGFERTHITCGLTPLPKPPLQEVSKFGTELSHATCTPPVRYQTNPGRENGWRSENGREAIYFCLPERKTPPQTHIGTVSTRVTLCVWVCWRCGCFPHIKAGIFPTRAPCSVLAVSCSVGATSQLIAVVRSRSSWPKAKLKVLSIAVGCRLAYSSRCAWWLPFCVQRPNTKGPSTT